MITSESKFIKDTKLEDGISLIFRNFSKKYFKEGSSVFISHKHGDLEYVYRLQNLLEEYGFVGWVDWQDDTMPKETSGETAQKLKEIIVAASKFILLATNEAIESKWCNWEVGFADHQKYIDHIALFPLQKNNEDFVGVEYLQIYPSIQTKNNNTKSDYYILYPDGTEISLENWLKI